MAPLNTKVTIVNDLSSFRALPQDQLVEADLAVKERLGEKDRAAAVCRRANRKYPPRVLRLSKIWTPLRSAMFRKIFTFAWSASAGRRSITFIVIIGPIKGYPKRGRGRKPVKPKRRRDDAWEFFPEEAGRYQCETDGPLTVKDAIPVCPYTWKTKRGNALAPNDDQPRK